MLPIPAARTLDVAADGLVFAGRGLLRGWSIDNAEATDATIVALYDGGSTGGVPIARVTVNAGASSNVFPGQGTIAFERGLYVDRGTQSARVVLYYNPETRLTTALGLFDDDTEDLTQIGVFQLLGNLGG